MPRLSSDVKELLQKSRDAAILAVDVYNKPATQFRSHAYIVLMIIAWTSLFHAIFERQKVKYYYKDEKDKRKYIVIDGEKRAWDLSKCCTEYYKGITSPIKANLDVLIGIRNKIEHRFLPALDLAIIGECHSMLFNYESLLTTEFGNQFSLNASLAIPLQLYSVDPEWQAKALRQLQSREYKVVKEYIDAYRTSLQQDILNSQEFCFRVYLLPKTGNREESSDIAMEFIKYDANDPEGMKKLEQLVTLIKEKQVLVPAVNPGMLKAGEVCKSVEKAINRNFRPSGQHVKCWKHYKIRPESKSETPELTNKNYCHYDVPHKDYVYTEAWVEFLISELSDPQKWDAIFAPKPPLHINSQ